LNKRPFLSVVIITLNEEKNIVRCLQSLQYLKSGYVKQEIIVVDAQSTDKTQAIAKKMGARVYSRAWKGFADQKNWAFGKVKGNWILSLDADEELTSELGEEILEKISGTPITVEGYFIKRKAFFLGKWIEHCGWWPDAQLRLVRSGRGKFTQVSVHEGLEVKGRMLELNEPMNHYAYDSIRQYLDKMNKYSDLAVTDAKPKKKTFWRFYLTVASHITFFRMYVLKMGFLDGWRGLAVCGLSAFHDFAKYAKLWEKEILNRDELETRP
jgi:glycosyltransferase involved in cell wall biosynthesis